MEELGNIGVEQNHVGGSLVGRVVLAARTRREIVLGLEFVVGVVTLLIHIDAFRVALRDVR